MAIDISKIKDRATALVFDPLQNAGANVLAQQFITLNNASGFTLTSQTAAQALFNSPTNGSITLGIGTYEWMAAFDLSSMSGTSGAFGFALAGTATVGYSAWTSSANKAALATAASGQITMNKNSVANTAICTATTGTVGWAQLNGIIRITAAGTLIPQVSLGIAAAAVVGQDSYFSIWPIGTSTVTSVGDWS